MFHILYKEKSLCGKEGAALPWKDIDKITCLECLAKHRKRSNLELAIARARIDSISEEIYEIDKRIMVLNICRTPGLSYGTER